MADTNIYQQQRRHVAANVISDLFPDRQIESLEDVMKLTTNELGQMMEEQDEFYANEYADDPEDDM